MRLMDGCVIFLIQIGSGGAENGNRILFLSSGSNMAGNNWPRRFPEGHLHQLPNWIRQNPCLRLAHCANALHSVSKVLACFGRAAYTGFSIAGLSGSLVPCSWNLCLIAHANFISFMFFSSYWQIELCSGCLSCFRLKRFLMLLLLGWDCQ